MIKTNEKHETLGSTIIMGTELVDQNEEYFRKNKSMIGNKLMFQKLASLLSLRRVFILVLLKNSHIYRRDYNGLLIRLIIRFSYIYLVILFIFSSLNYLYFYSSPFYIIIIFFFLILNVKLECINGIIVHILFVELAIHSQAVFKALLALVLRTSCARRSGAGSEAIDCFVGVE